MKYIPHKNPQHSGVAKEFGTNRVPLLSKIEPSTNHNFININCPHDS